MNLKALLYTVLTMVLAAAFIYCVYLYPQILFIVAVLLVSALVYFTFSGML